jgi:polyvinyl alcohol dehydrogenase (cytochrome)
MRLGSFASWAACILVALAGSPLRAQDGEYLFKTYCAICHEAANGEQARGPDRNVLRQMTPEHILDVLERGAMKAQAAERSRTQRRILAEYLSGKSFGETPPDLIPKSAFCAGGSASFSPALAGPPWNRWSPAMTNTRFQPAEAAGLSATEVPRLKLKWVFGYPGASSGGTQPVVVNGRLYVGTAEGDIYSLDAKTGCVYWTFQTQAGVRSAISIGKTADGKLAAFFGDQSANVYAIDAGTGKLLWQTKVDDYWRAAITAAPALYDGHLYVPVSSREESQVGDAKYPCCRFRGSMVALDASNGKMLWKTYTISDEADQIGKNSAGTQLWGPSGVPIWNTPAVDVKRGLLYSGTGNNYSTPATNLSDSIVAFDMTTGKIRWVSQVVENDIWNTSCLRPNRNPAVCPEADAPDADFSSSPILIELKGGRQIIFAAAKSSVVYALDPDQNGKILWQQRMGVGGASGGVMWGPAADLEKIYVANADFDSAHPDAAGGLSAFDPSTGGTVWSMRTPSCENKKPCKPSLAAAVTAIPGVVFSGSMDGRLRALSTQNGKVLWEYDTAQSYETVNHVKANGGSMSNAGPTVVGGMVFVNSGYSHHGGIMPGNVLLGFAVD